MSHWNYRMTVRTLPDGLGGTEELWEVRELHYDDDGNVTAWTEDPVGPAGSTWREIADAAARIATATATFPAFDLDTREWRPRRRRRAHNTQPKRGIR